MLDMFIFFCLCSWSLAGVFGVEVKSLSVTVGDSVSLHISVTEEQRTDEIRWWFGHDKILIAKLNRINNNSTFYDNAADGKFRGRLKLDNQTGSLTITNSRTTDSGLYNVTNKIGKSLFTFNCTVYARLPVPDVLFKSSQCSSSSSSSLQNCSVVCSVVNVSAVSLSWYKGNSLLSSISVSDLSSSISLHLEVEYQDTNTYSCVINNPISNQTTHLDITRLCQPCPEYIYCFGVEAVIRLVLAAMVSVATVAVLIYDIRTRSLHLKRRGQTSASNTDQSHAQKGRDAHQ